MKYEDFFHLPQSERDRLMAIHRKQNIIRTTSAQIKKQYDELNTQYRKNQEDCLHPFTKKEHIRTEDYGCAPAFSTNFYCEDCDKHWREEGSK